MEENGKFVIRKVPIEKFMDILSELYNRGLDYIDIHYTKESDIEDNVILGYFKEYMNPDAPEDAFEDLKELIDENPDKKLTDDDINQITLWKIKLKIIIKR